MTLLTAPIEGESGPIQVGPGALFSAPLGTSEILDLVGAPSSSDFALDDAWSYAGYTDQGSEISQQLTVNDVEVEEELEPIEVRVTKRITTVNFAAAQVTRKNLQLAYNGGTASAPTFTNAVTGALVAGAITSIPLDTALVTALPTGSTVKVGSDVFTTTARALPGATTLAVTGTSTGSSAHAACTITSANIKYDPPATGQESRRMLLHVSEDGLIVFLFRRALQVGNVQQQMKKAPQKRLLACSFRCEKPTGKQPWTVLLDKSLDS